MGDWVRLERRQAVERLKSNETNIGWFFCCWIVLKLSGISDEIVIKNSWDFEQNRTIFY